MSRHKTTPFSRHYFFARRARHKQPLNPKNKTHGEEHRRCHAPTTRPPPARTHATNLWYNRNLSNTESYTNNKTTKQGATAQKTSCSKSDVAIMLPFQTHTSKRQYNSHVLVSMKSNHCGKCHRRCFVSYPSPRPPHVPFGSSSGQNMSNEFPSPKSKHRSRAQS